RRRRAADARFRFYGVAAISVGLLFLAALLVSVVAKGYPAFQQTMIKLDVELKRDVIDSRGLGAAAVMTGDVFRWDRLVNAAVVAALDVDPDDAAAAEDARKLLSSGSRIRLRDTVARDPSLIGSTHEIWLIADDVVDSFVKGSISADTPESRRQINDRQI